MRIRVFSLSCVYSLFLPLALVKQWVRLFDHVFEAQHSKTFVIPPYPVSSQDYVPWRSKMIFPFSHPLTHNNHFELLMGLQTLCYHSFWNQTQQRNIHSPRNQHVLKTLERSLPVLHWIEVESTRGWRGQRLLIALPAKRVWPCIGTDLKRNL